MDHDLAVRAHAAERYTVGELSPDEREQFEEHFFMCAECAEEVRWEQIFAANARAALREAPIEKAPRLNWFAWLMPRPALGLSLAFNLVLVVGAGVLTLHWRSQLRQATAPQLVAVIAVPTLVRGADESVIQARAGQSLPLSFALRKQFPQFTYEISRVDGSQRLAGTVAPPAGPSEELLLTIPTLRLEPGDYLVVLRGLEDGKPVDIGRCRIRILE